MNLDAYMALMMAVQEIQGFDPHWDKQIEQVRDFQGCDKEAPDKEEEEEGRLQRRRWQGGRRFAGFGSRRARFSAG